ncbi:phage tail protein [Neobacillus vireti]|uniref:phage tail protein n=1 Tax=Neobacillus vireti TaxID=220686 RepID=UPI002FFFEF22
MKKTNLFVFDGQTEQLLTVLSNEDNSMSPFWEAPVEEKLNGDFIFEFKAPMNNSLVEGNLVAFKDQDGEFQLFQIYKANKYHIDNQLNVHVWCEHSFYELVDDIVEDLRVVDGAAQEALTKALSNSRWKVGEVADLGLGTVNFYYSSASQNLQDIVKTFGGELRYRVTISGNQITGRFVDLLARRGSDTGNRFEYNQDLVEIKRTVQVDGLKTALYGRGKGEEIEETGGYSRKITFADVVWSTANGDPVDKPAGQEWVGDPAALAKWGRTNGTRHKFGTFDCDTTDPVELLNQTWQELQRVSQPLVTYELKVIDLARITGLDHKKVRIGDTVYVIDRDLEIRIEARVIKITYDLDAPENSELILGNYIEDITDFNKKLLKIEAKITDRQGVWDKANNAISTVDDSEIVNEVPSVPQNVSAVGLFKSIILKWTFDPSIKVSAYEVYGSKVQGFTVDSTNLLFRGKSGGYVHNAETNETWFFRVRALNPAGVASGFTQEFSATTIHVGTVDFEDLSVTNEKVSDLSADKITFGTLDGNKATIVNIDADNITSGMIKSQFIQIGSSTTYEEGYDPTTKATNDDLVAVQNRVSNVEFSVSEDNIISTVRNSISYQNDLLAKANAEDLAGYASTDDLTQGIAEANSYTDGKISNVNAVLGTNLVPTKTVFEQISEVDQKADAIDFKFTHSGGVNLLKNSAGFAGTSFWKVVLDKDSYGVDIGSVDTEQNAELSEKGVGSGFVLNGAKISQDIVYAPQKHTISALVKKGTAGSGYIKVTYVDASGTRTQQVDFNSGTKYDYEKFEIFIEPVGNTITVEVYGTSDSSLTVTGLMANVGNVALQWQPSAGEVYNTNVLMDLNGIRVNSTSYNGYTAITPEEFAGYAEVPDENNNLVMQKVFTLNKDVTEMSKVNVDKEITMTPVKVVPVISTDYTGWAFIAEE